MKQHSTSQMGTKRSWTPTSIASFHAIRNAKRAKSGLPEWEVTEPAAKEKSLAAEKAEIIEREWNRLKNEAWALEKPPIEECRAPFTGMLVLPKTFQGRHGVDRVGGLISACELSNRHIQSRSSSREEMI